MESTTGPPVWQKKGQRKKKKGEEEEGEEGRGTVKKKRNMNVFGVELSVRMCCRLDEGGEGEAVKEEEAAKDVQV